MRFVSPPLLGSGARVALIAPAGPLGDEAELECAIENTHALEWEPVLGLHVRERLDYLAGTDAHRVNDLNRALSDPSIDGIWCLRGGYGVLRILEMVDFEALRRTPKAVIGFSDITALHASICAKAGVVSYHGPTARGKLSAFSKSSLHRAVTRGVDSAGAVEWSEVLVGGAARGRLAGGNLAVLMALAGTSFFPNLEGSILVLEDVNEPVYRIDRMLRHLLLTGALSGVAGLVFGAFTERGDADDSASLARVLRETAEAVRVPCLAGAPIGHIDEQWTLPIGAVAELNATDRNLTIDVTVNA